MKEKQSNKKALVVVSAVAAGIFVLSGLDYQRKENQSAVQAAIFDDLAFGRTVGGSLHSEAGQFVCIDPADAFRGRFDASDGGVRGASDAIRDELIKSSRCTVTGSDARFDMTADGRERFTTPHGSIALWAG